ncbi:unnamed protein product, partial [Clonostachys chloroleuca]
MIAVDCAAEHPKCSREIPHHLAIYLLHYPYGSYWCLIGMCTEVSLASFPEGWLASLQRNILTAASSLTYLARMSAGLPDDLALSTTYIPATKSQFCIVYGCNKSQMQKVQRRISLAGDGLHHPLTAVGIFAEIERERLVNAVDDLVDQFSLRAEVLDMKYWNTDIPVDNRKTRENLAICLRSRELADQIRSTKRQVSKFISQVDRFNEWMTDISREGTNNTVDAKERIKLRETGERIKGRLQDILHEYDDKIDECKMMSESLSLIMQTQWNQIAQKDSTTNTKIARVNNMIAIETKTESIQMKSIALLTMIYIPLSCVA